MFDKRTRKHLETNWKGVSSKNRSERGSKLCRYVTLALSDLALYAEREPEDQLTQALKPASVGPLIRALTGEGCEVISARHYEIAKIMLSAAAQRLQALIDENYRPIVIPLLNNIVMLMTFLPAVPPQPRPPLSSDTVKAQREKTRKEREAIIREYAGQLVPKKAD